MGGGVNNYKVRNKLCTELERLLDNSVSAWF